MAICWLLPLILSKGVALADNGPHGAYTPTTDACASCHRTHTAPAAQLLLNSTPGLCLTCHDGTGAITNTADGVDNLGNSLRGGGFVNTRMDADMTGPQMLPVSSAHETLAGSNTVWGYGPVSAVADPGLVDVSLTCTNCHNPHGRAGVGGTPTYRILKGASTTNTPLFVDNSGTVSQGSGVDLPDEDSKDYTVSAGDYFGDHGSFVAPNSINALLTAWCAQCHTRHKPTNLSGAPAESGHTDSGDAIFAFRHVTNIEDATGCKPCHDSPHGMSVPPLPGCVTCHLAHGTGARMGSNSDTVPWPDGTTTPVGDARSALLRLDNRGVCQECHNK